MLFKEGNVPSSNLPQLESLLIALRPWRCQGKVWLWEECTKFMILKSWNTGHKRGHATVHGYNKQGLAPVGRRYDTPKESAKEGC